MTAVVSPDGNLCWSAEPGCSLSRQLVAVDFDMKLRSILKGVLLGFGAIAVGIQFVPVERTNPPVAGSPVWASPRTEALARAACFDCHSNETRWPWYSRIAPLSWLVADHVNEGRAKLNFSVPPFEEADDAAESVQNGEMPMSSYAAIHAGARLSEAERAELVAGLVRTFGGEVADASGGRERGDDREREGHDD